MASYRVKIEGITDYMQHRMDDASLAEWEVRRGKIMERPEVSQEDAKRAEFHCYRNDKGQCYIPAEHIQGALIAAGTEFKSKVGSGRKSMKNVVAAMFMIFPDEIKMVDYDAIDKRSAVNKNVKARVIVVRPKWTEWEAEFTLEVDDDAITPQMIKDILAHAGKYVGIGSFRPTNNGKFGRFEIKEFERQ